MASPRLSRRSHQDRLPVYTDGADLSFVDLLRAEACGGAWRIVEAYSASGAPFELRAAWSGGDGMGQEARITVPRATRLSVFASSLSLRVANLGSVENRVGCNVSDGYCVSRNQYEVRETGSANLAQGLFIPPFAHLLRVDCADPTQLASMRVRLYDGVGVLRADLTGDVQPEPGLPLGGAGEVTVTAPDALRYRGVFLLSI